ncbi:MAG: hypothetical protein AAYR31_00445 [Candidatus Vidania fulgoroideorum]
MNLFIKKKTKRIKRYILIASSKSLTNRLLFVSCLCFKNSTFLINPLYSEDTKIMLKNIKKINVKFKKIKNKIEIKNKKIKLRKSNFYFENAGTVARPFIFLISIIKKKKPTILDGNKSMRLRPIKGLIKLIKKIYKKIKIKYIKKKNHFPLKIYNFIKNINKKKIKINENKSSQFLSSFIFLIPLITKRKFNIEIKNIVSINYIFMTINIMKLFNIKIKENKKNIEIIKSKYKNNEKNIYIEGDIVSASYFFINTLIKRKRIFIFNLTNNSIQAERKINNLLKIMNIGMYFYKKGICFYLKKDKNIKYLKVNCENIIDLSLVIPLLSIKKIKNIKIYNIYNWKFKECKRNEIIKKEIMKKGIYVTKGKNWIIFKRKINCKNNGTLINTFRDHRIAMTFSTIMNEKKYKFKKNSLLIRNPNNVKKTFPKYFK